MRSWLLLAVLLPGCSCSKEPQRVIVEFEKPDKPAEAESTEVQRMRRIEYLRAEQAAGRATPEDLAELAALEAQNKRRSAEFRERIKQEGDAKP